MEIFILIIRLVETFTCLSFAGGSWCYSRTHAHTDVLMHTQTHRISAESTILFENITFTLIFEYIKTLYEINN